MATSGESLMSDDMRGTQLKSDEEEIWEGLRTLIVGFLVLLVIGLFVLSVLDLPYEVFGMQIAYTAAIISLPFFIAASVILALGHRRFHEERTPADPPQQNLVQ